jgi:hypothetical protein
MSSEKDATERNASTVSGAQPEVVWNGSQPAKN